MDSHPFTTASPRAQISRTVFFRTSLSFDEPRGFGPAALSNPCPEVAVKDAREDAPRASSGRSPRAWRTTRAPALGLREEARKPAGPAREERLVGETAILRRHQ